MSEAQFPISAEVRTNESGLGYCLRLAELNGVGVAQLKRIAGIGPNDSLRRTHAVILARLFGVDSVVLRHMLPDIWRTSAAMMGHQFDRKGMLRIRKAQICPICVHEKGYLKDDWDIGIAVCCLEHRVCLVDQCPKCRQGLSWTRSFVSWGQCGHYLGSEQGLLTPSDMQVKAQCILEKILRCTSAPGTALAGAMFSSFSAMSISGWIQLMFALGLRDGPGHPIFARSFSYSPVALQGQKIVARGVARLEILCNSGDSGETLATVIFEDLLGRIACGSTSEIDRLLCQRLYKVVFGADRYLDLLRQSPVAVQIDMFGDMV